MQLIPEHFARQFKKPQSSDFPGVVIPLGQSQRHASLSGIEKKPVEKTGSDSPTSEEEKGRSSGDNAYDSHTIEGLRAEVESDASAFGASGAYDRMFSYDPFSFCPALFEASCMRCARLSHSVVSYTSVNWSASPSSWQCRRRPGHAGLLSKLFGFTQA